MKLRAAILAACLGLSPAAFSQSAPDPAALKKAVAVAGSPLYIAPDTNSTQVGGVLPGQEVGIESQTNGFLKIFNGVSGWMPDHGLVYLDDPHGAEVLFGMAVEAQAQAESGPAERGQAEAAARLFSRVVEDFPASPRAPEAMFRAADVLWQLGMADQPTRHDPSERQFPEDGPLKKVESRYPDSPWAARAAFDLLAEHFTCGELTAKPDCIGKAINTYEDYVKKYPAGPRTAEAAYDAVFDAAVGATVYSGPTHPDPGKAREYKAKVAADADQMGHAFAGSDWAAKAALVAYQVAQGTPVYPAANGNPR